MELIVLVSIAQRSAQFLILADDVADVAVVQGNVVGYEVGARVVQLEVGGRPAYWSIIPIVVAEGVAGYPRVAMLPVVPSLPISRSGTSAPL